ncbi:MAG TPA: membrane protein insertase YidC [Bryobacteraceae bacterium]|jgi:YidC/Oxa1 family membrane protein insertase|nr:membrane protein insertase YidC [Bryobacteraceae bacterium]
MAETSGNKGLGQQPEQMSTETRLLLAFLLMGAIMFLTPYFFKSQAPTPAAKKSTQASVEQTAVAPTSAETKTPPPAATAAPQPTASAAPTAPVTQAQSQPPLVIDTEYFKITFSNQGANVRAWELKKSFADGKPLQLVNSAATIEDRYPFDLYMAEHKELAQKLNGAVYEQTVDPDGLGVNYSFSDGHATVRKTFRFAKDSYLADVTSEVEIDGQPVSNALEWRGGFGDLTVKNPAASQKTIYFNIDANSLKEQTVSAAKNGPATAEGNFSFAGIEDTYFTAVFLPATKNATVREVTFSDTTPIASLEKPAAYTGAAISMGPVNHFKLFVGPKDYDLLKHVDPKLEQLVNFGWMSLLAKPLFLIVNWFNDNMVHNFGWAIVVVTVVINMALFPVKLSNMKSMRKMQALKPQVDEINAKYKNIKMTDPRKGEQNQEVMDLYKKYGVNPMGGCVPMLLQIPFFFAFYKVLFVSVEMRGAPWLWIHDLSQAETSAIKILPIIMIVSQFYMQSMTPQANVDPNQQKMMKFMPLIFGFMFYQFPSGLVLYYLTSNLVGMGQQWFFNHTEAAQEAARSVEPPKKKKDGKK